MRLRSKKLVTDEEKLIALRDAVRVGIESAESGRSIRFRTAQAMRIYFRHYAPPKALATERTGAERRPPAGRWSLDAARAD